MDTIPRANRKNVFPNNKKYGSRRLIKTEQKRTFIPLSVYPKKFKSNLTQEDISNLLIRDNDTLVMISNKDFYRKGISVPYEPKDSAFLELYKDIVFLKYKNSKNSSKPLMRHWKGPLNIFITKNIHSKVRNKLKKFATYLNKEVDSLHIRFVNKLEKSNYVIYGVNSDEDYIYEPKIKTKTLDYYVHWNKRQEIYNARLQIDTRAYKTRKKLLTETLRLFVSSLGHFNWTYKLPKENYFSAFPFSDKAFTKVDLELLKYHYSYGICKGVSFKIFEETHQRAQEIFKKSGKHIFFKHKK